MTTVRLPTPLRTYAEGQKEVEIDAGSVADALQDLTKRYPGLKQHLFDDHGDLRRYVNVYLNDEDVRDLQGVETEMQNGDRLMIVPSIAGGRGASPR
jgi:adenylyltransferase/sulfurtransferase